MVKTPRRLAGASSAAISGLKWTLEEGVSISGDILAAELADPSGSALARAQIDVSAHLGDETAAAFSFRMRAFGVAGREAAYNGVKATVAYRDVSGAAQYPQVAAHIGCSARMLQLSYKSVFGRTMHEDIIDMRLDRAKKLLVDTDLPVGRIPELCGSDAPNHFARLFKARTGMTMLQFRRARRSSRDRLR